MAVILGTMIGKEVADLLGLKETRNIKITFPYDDFVQVEVEALMERAAGEKFTGWLQTKRYKLEFLDEDEPVEMERDEHGFVDDTSHGATWRTKTAAE